MTKQEINLFVKGDRVIIHAPYDKDLVQGIKVIQSTQRKWVDNKWVIALDDPQQKPDEMTNLEHLQEICSKCAIARGWKFFDHTIVTKSDIEQDKEATKQQKIADFIQAVSKLPKASLKLARWGSETLQLQLNYYLGEDSREMFMELFNASINSYKAGFFSGDHKATSGFMFEIYYSDEIIKALLEKSTTFLKDRRNLDFHSSFENGIAHFFSTEGLWIGIPVEMADMGSINWEARSWEISSHENRLYWVVSASDFVSAWANESKFNISWFGGNFGIINQQPRSLPSKIEIFHLKDWMEDFLAHLLDMPVKGQTISRPWCYQASNYSHPVDNFMPFISDEAKTKIANLKRCAAEEAIAADRANAQSLAATVLDGYLKADLIEKYGDHFSLRQSWSKKRIIEEICRDQAVCELLLNIPT